MKTQTASDTFQRDKFIEPVKLQPWATKISRGQTEALILSGCLKDTDMLRAMRDVLPARAFSDVRNRVTWVTLCNLAVDLDTAQLVKAVRYAVEDWEHRRTGRYWQGFYDWFSGILDASPAPCLTPYHVAWLLELHAKGK